jgi:hypothetical protein
LQTTLALVTQRPDTKTRAERRRDRKQRFFDEGCQALERIAAQIPARAYVCPLCLCGFTAPDELTWEDVPPKSIGGRKMLLTCEDCNHAGSRIDAELRKAQDMRDWSRGRLGRSLRVRTEVGGVPLNADIDNTAGKITVAGVPTSNDPANTVAHTAELERLASTGDLNWEFRVDFPGYRERPARIALLRAGYLAAFAAFGYRYIFQERLNVVREQIANPDTDLIDRFSLHLSTPMERRRVLWFEGPPQLECILVQIDDSCIFLPGLKGRTPGIYEHLEARKIWPPRRRTFAAAVIHPRNLWSKRPLYSTDH